MELISRKEALEKGLLFYFTGKTCKNGHVDVYYTKSKFCRQCAVEKNERLFEKGKEARKQKRLASIALTPGARLVPGRCQSGSL